MQFIQHHIAQIFEKLLRHPGRDQKCKLLRRGQQNIRRRQFLALTLVGRCVAGAGLDGNIKPHFLHRHSEIAANIDSKRLQRRDIERVNATF